jgi:hypothetical protein
VLLASGLRVRGGTATPEGTPGGGREVLSCRPVVTAPAAVRRCGPVADAKLLDLVRLGELGRDVAGPQFYRYSLAKSINARTNRSRGSIVASCRARVFCCARQPCSIASSIGSFGRSCGNPGASFRCAVPARSPGSLDASTESVPGVPALSNS